jgi:RimJ/RimL family protein N-acetyltransferase
MQIEIASKTCLTEFRHSDIESLVLFLNDRDIYDRTSRIPYPYTISDAEQWLNIVAKANKRNGQSVNWAIRQEERVIGAIGLHEFIIGQSHSADIGYWLGKPFWGKGIMTAVVKAVCSHAFENFGIVRIHAHVFSFNIASSRVLEKCGFEQEGYLRKYFVKDGKYFDAKTYGLLK